MILNDSGKFFLVLLISTSTASLGLMTTLHAKDVQQSKFAVNLYYETMCPGCRAFSSQQLCPTYEKLGDYFDIDFVPYGNAKTTIDKKTKNISIECQHGVDECTGNRIQSCALKHLSYEQSTKFICCMESSQGTFDPTGSNCALKLGIDIRPIKNCSDGPEGNLFHYLNGMKTSKLKPKHTYVPWILFNGTYNQEDMEHAHDDLISVLCKYLDPQPTECNDID